MAHFSTAQLVRIGEAIDCRVSHMHDHDAPAYRELIELRETWKQVLLEQAGAEVAEDDAELEDEEV